MPVISVLLFLESHHELCQGRMNSPEENSQLLPSLGARGDYYVLAKLKVQIFSEIKMQNDDVFFKESQIFPLTYTKIRGVIIFF